MQSSKSEIQQLNLQLEKLRQSQLSEIDQRCSEVDALKQQLSDQLTSLQNQCNSLSSKLADATSEKKCLLERISRLESDNESLTSRCVEQSLEWDRLNCKFQRAAEHEEKLELENKAINSHLHRLLFQFIGVCVCVFKKTLLLYSLLEDLERVRVSNSGLKNELKTVKAKFEDALFQLESARSSSSLSSQQVQC